MPQANFYEVCDSMGFYVMDETRRMDYRMERKLDKKSYRYEQLQPSLQRIVAPV